jgi:hypothetical protein
MQSVHPLFSNIDALLYIARYYDYILLGSFYQKQIIILSFILKVFVFKVIRN